MDDLISRQVTIAQPKNTCENTCEVARSANDCISRQAAIDELRDAENHAFNSYHKGLIKAHKIIAGLPSAQPEQKKGEWICEYDGKFTGGAYWFSCSKCKRIVPDVRNGGWNFCPNCGAYMTDKEGAQNDRQNNIPVTDMD